MNNTAPTIVFFGRTGSGKSFLANQIAGSKIFNVGDTLYSETDNTVSREVKWPLDLSRRVKLVDTPGFADNRSEITNEELLSNLLKFLKNLEGGFNIGLFCMSATKTRADAYDMQELEMIGLLLGKAVFDHTFIVITQVDTLCEERRAEACKKFTAELPGLLKQNGLPDFEKEKILISDVSDFKRTFLEPLSVILKKAPAYEPQIAKEVDPEDPDSIKKYLATPEMKAAIARYEEIIAQQKIAMEKREELFRQQQEENARLLERNLEQQEEYREQLSLIEVELNGQKNVNAQMREQYEKSQNEHNQKLRGLEDQLSNQCKQNQYYQEQIDKKQKEIQAFSDKINQLQMTQQQQKPQVVVVRDGGGRNSCNIF